MRGSGWRWGLEERQGGGGQAVCRYVWPDLVLPYREQTQSHVLFSTHLPCSPSLLLLLLLLYSSLSRPQSLAPAPDGGLVGDEVTGSRRSAREIGAAPR